MGPPAEPETCSSGSGRGTAGRGDSLKAPPWSRRRAGAPHLRRPRSDIIPPRPAGRPEVAPAPCGCFLPISHSTRPQFRCQEALGKAAHRCHMPMALFPWDRGPPSPAFLRSHSRVLRGRTTNEHTWTCMYHYTERFDFRNRLTWLQRLGSLQSALRPAGRRPSRAQGSGGVEGRRPEDPLWLGELGLWL